MTVIIILGIVAVDGLNYLSQYCSAESCACSEDIMDGAAFGLLIVTLFYSQQKTLLSYVS